MKFVNLHAHTTFSIGDGLNYPDDHFNFVVENAESESMGMAITDHGNCNSFGYALQSLSSLKKKGINFHFIPGCEMYIHPDLDQWKKFKEEEQEEDEEGTIEIESESKSKNKWYDPLKRRHHLVVLAQNKKGIENLNKLVSWSFENGMYRYPRVDFKRLEQFNEGLIISTACMAGLPMWLILRDLEKGKEQVFKSLDNELKPLLDIFGPERAYLELQFNKIEEQKILNKYLIEYSQKSGYKTIATADSHYARPDYWKSREMYKLLAYQSRKMKVSAEDLPASKEDLKCELYPKSGKQMFEAYKQYDSELDETIVKDSIKRTWNIAHDMVEKFIPDGKYKLPKLSHKVSDIDRLKELANEGLRKKGLDNNKEYVDRLNRELSIIEKKNYSLYFLVLLEALNEIKKECLIGHGRGSGAGSLVCYVLGITNLDPIKWNLLFERFLSENRTEAVDIDSDVEDRELVLSILRRHFGEESIILITNYNTLQLKSLVKDISKFYNIPFDEVNKVTSVVEEEAKQSILDEVGGDQKLYSLTYDGAYKYSPTFKTFIDKYPQVNESIKILFKQNKSIGVHAGGTVITENAECHMPLIMRKPDKKSYQKQTPWSEGLTVKHLEQFGIIKYDFLGLETLKMIKNCIFNILKKEGKPQTLQNMFQFYNENLLPEILGEGEQKVFENIYHNGKFLSIFQFTEKGVCEFAKKAKPTRVSDISAITALWRPGPLCIGENSTISINLDGKKKRISDLYNKFHSISSSERRKFPLYLSSLDEKTNQLFKNKILNIVESGEKLTYKIVFQKENRSDRDKEIKSDNFKYSNCVHSITSTGDHLFLTKNGWKKLLDLKLGDYLCFEKKYSFTSNDPKAKNRKINSIKGQKTFRATAFNNYEYKCIYCDWNNGSLDVNHIDGNRKTNNNVDNLSFLCPNHHREFSEGNITKEQLILDREKFRLFNNKDVQYVRFLRIEEFGIEKCYDIQVEGPNHNFIAGGFVVHNCDNADQKYLDAIENPNLIKYEHQVLKEVLSSSRGIIIYQEQFMILANKLAGFTLTEADELRKLLVKPVTSLGDEMKKKRIDVGERFVEGCVSSGLTKERANKLWFEEILPFCSYGFNKSHSDCYAMLSYQCAWLFHYYPVQWAAAVLESEAASSAKPDEKARAISLVKSFGFNIIFPDINKSEDKWKIVDEKTIAAPFTLIKSVGDKAVPEIIKGQPYKSIEDLLFNDNLVYRLLNKRVIDVLCKSGALDELIDQRFDNDGHFRHCVAEMRSEKETKTSKKFNDYILETRGRFESITRDQKILDKQSLLGYFDVDSIISQKVKSIFIKNGYLPISTYPEYQIPEVWYILVGYENKISQKGNQYYLLTVIDDSYKENIIYMYDADPSLLINNSIYYGKITKYNEHFGFSIYDARRVIKRVQ